MAKLASNLGRPFQTSVHLPSCETGAIMAVNAKEGGAEKDNYYKGLSEDWFTRMRKLESVLL